MEVVDNINHLLGDDLKLALVQGTKICIAASCFSIYAYDLAAQRRTGIAHELKVGSDRRADRKPRTEQPAQRSGLTQ